MKSTVAQRLFLTLLILGLLFYGGLQVWWSASLRYKTETVYSYTVSESAEVDGLLLRQEEVLPDRIGSGVAVYLAQDGDKVSIGYPITEVYRSAEDAKNTARLRELTRQKEQLEEAQDPGTTTYLQTDVLNKQIFSELGSIIDAVNAGRMETIAEDADDLLVLMNKKEIATGRQENFNGEIERLEAEMSYYSGRNSQDPRVISASKPGYFIRKLDGFEGAVDFSQLDELDPQSLRRLMNRPEASEEDGRVGKLMTDHNWYYAALVSAEEAGLYQEGVWVTLDFSLSGMGPVDAFIYQINQDPDTGEAVVLFRSDYINEQLVNLRITPATVTFRSIRGLRVSSSAIQYQGIERGVYVVRGDVMQFKPVTLLYEGNGFVLCLETDLMDPSYESNLKQYDEVVVEGAQLYDNKPMQ